MLSRTRIALNRIIRPNLDLDHFLALASDLGLSMVELRNDLPGGRITDGMEPRRVCGLADRYGVRIVSINALQKFNLVDNLPAAVEELKGLLELSAAIHCPAVVLCPLNDQDDRRDPQQSFEQTVGCLRAFHPIFVDAGVLGYIEPLGFAESSLPSLLTAQAAIRESKAPCFRLVYDTFHHFIGPDSPEELKTELDMGLVGLVHASGVEADLPGKRYRDGHRGLITDADRFRNVEQISLLLDRGYTGPISLEPFASEIQNLPRARFIQALSRSLDLLCRADEQYLTE
jgi:2-keto-myo-inositol isomerase